MGKYTKEDIIRMVQEEDIQFIRMQFTDIFGQLKNVAITASQIERAVNNEIMMDGSSIEGFVRIEESDQYLWPDLDTFAILPWRPQYGKVARLICDVHNPDGTSFQGDPRSVLKRELQRAERLGYTFNVGPELEFFLFQTDENGRPTTQTSDEAGYFDLGPLDHGESTRREVTLAQKNGLHATFMPKPVYGAAGNGMHVNMSLFQNGRNAFYDESAPNQLSPLATQFIAGLLAHARGFCALTNPLVNSYKRLVPGYEAPCYPAWSTSNRSALIRIPAPRGQGTRVELRSPDPTCNPYLVFAACLAAGLDGIEQGLTPPAPISRNIYEMTAEERSACGLESLPGTLEAAIRALEADSVVLDALGPHTALQYITGKLREWEEYRTQVSQWELDKYLVTY